MSEVDKELKDLRHFIGTEQYHKLPLFNTNLTDGVAYVMKNGYSWFITDSLAVIETKLKDEEFLSVKLKLLKDNQAEMVITDGNDKVFYTQKYGYTDAKSEVDLYWTDNVFMVSSEYWSEVEKWKRK